MRRSMDRGPDGNRNSWYMGTGIAIGVAIGTGIGLALDNLALGIGAGIAIGAGIGGAFMAWRDEDE